MRINTTSKNYPVNEALTSWIEKKTGKLDKLLKESTEVQVKLSQPSSAVHCAEITIYLDGAILRIEEAGDDVYTCLDNAVDKIIRQIRKHRTKLDKRLRSGAYETVETLTEAVEEVERNLVKTKRFTMKPMSVDDAIAQMEMLGHSFFMFIDEETGRTGVVYNRDDGNYGLLAPENA